MKHTNISRVLACRIEDIMDEHGAVNFVTGPAHDPFASWRVRIDIRSALGRFLTKKGYVDRMLIAKFDDFVTIFEVHLDKRVTGTPRLRLVATAV